MTQRLRIDSGSDGVLVVTLDRPPVHAVDRQLATELRQTFLDVADSDTRSVVLTATGGRVFSAGADKGMFPLLATEEGRTFLKLLREMYWAILDCPVPVIGAANGAAMGAGFAMLACCDIVIAARGATFGLPEVDAGVVGGGKHAARLLPEAVMRKMFFTAQPLDAEVLLHYGAIAEIVAPDALLPRALELAAFIAAKNPAAIRAAKASLNEIEFMPLKDAYKREQEYVIELAKPDVPKG